MKRYLVIGLLIAGSLTASNARDCSLEGKLTAEDIITEIPDASTEEKFKECQARGEFFENRVHSCDKGTFETGCKEKINEHEGEGE